MAFQRKGNSRGAVREYLAIARILDMQGDSKKALQMCRAAMRLDPDNPDEYRQPDGSFAPFETRTIRIDIADSLPQTDIVRSTRHGPGTSCVTSR